MMAALLKLLIVVAVSKAVAGESCYECDSRRDPGPGNCNNTVSADTATTVCDEDTCRVQVEMSPAGTTYSRGCSTGEGCLAVVLRDGQNSIISQCCHGHTCNGQLTAKTIKCYQCNPTDESCKKSVNDDALLLDCPGQCYSSYMVRDNVESYERGCSLLTCPRSSNTRTLTAAECCTTDKCNADVDVIPPTQPGTKPPSSDGVEPRMAWLIYALGLALIF